mmetsp:Transcript_20399/g.37121  ORF Transcript_20399/g.37121 Transcript_20399/m.37121 type:complete len:407 (+) Transcript_20399:16-1236(+)
MTGDRKKITKFEVLRAFAVGFLSCVGGAGIGYLAGHTLADPAINEAASLLTSLQGKVADHLESAARLPQHSPGVNPHHRAHRPSKGKPRAHTSAPIGTPSVPGQVAHMTAIRSPSRPAAHRPIANKEEGAQLVSKSTDSQKPGAKLVPPCSAGSKAKIPEFACKLLRRHGQAMFSGHANKAHFHFLHIDKTGGSTIETVMRIKFQGHNPLPMRANYKAYHWITILRDPLERIASQYYFRLSGRSQRDFKQRQKVLCMAGTGRAYKKKCKPKISLYEYGVKHSERNHEWRMVTGNPKLSCTTARIWTALLSHFWIVGTTPRLKEVMVILVKVFRLPPLKFSSSTHRKKGSYAPYTETLSKSRIQTLRRANSCDTRLYSIGQHFLDQLVAGFGASRMAEELKRAAAAR